DESPKVYFPRSSDLALAASHQPRNVLMVPDPKEEREEYEQQRCARIACEREQERRCGARSKRSDRGVTCEPGDREPDDAERDRNRPGESDQDANVGGDALATPEFKPDRIEMPKESSESRDERQFSITQSSDDKDGEGALDGIAGKRGQCETFAPGP